MYRQLNIHRNKYGLVRSILMHALEAYANTNAKKIEISGSYALGVIKQMEAFAQYKKDIGNLAQKNTNLMKLKSRYDALSREQKETVEAGRVLEDIKFLQGQVDRLAKLIKRVDKKRRVKVTIKLGECVQYFKTLQNTEQARLMVMAETDHYTRKDDWIKLFEFISDLQYDNI